MPQKSINFLIEKYGNINDEHATIYSYVLAMIGKQQWKGKQQHRTFLIDTEKQEHKERKNW